MNLDDIQIANPDAYVGGVPHEHFAYLRRHAPVFRQQEANGPGFWSITRHADISRISRDPATFAQSPSLFIDDLPPGNLRDHPDIMINMDPPRHTRYRALVNKGFTPRVIQSLEGRIRKVVTDLIDGFAERGKIDFVSAFSNLLPLQIIIELVGVPPEDHAQVLDFSVRFFGAMDPDYQGGPVDFETLLFNMDATANRLADLRRRDPKDDMLSELMAAEIDGERLNHTEFGGFFRLLLGAGHDTTKNLLSNGMLTLIQNPAQRQRLIADRSLIPTAVEEMLRFTPSAYYFRRNATRDVEIRGQKIAAGDKVIMWYVSGNRDEEVFRDPDTFDVGRTPNEHLTFGIGPHYCLGAALARLETRIALEELLRRLPDIELDGPVARLRSNWIHGIKSLPVCFTPTNS